MTSEQLICAVVGVGALAATAGMTHFFISLIDERKAHQKTRDQRDKALKAADTALAGWHRCITDSSEALLKIAKAAQASVEKP